MRKLAEAAGAAVVLSPGSTGVLPDAHPQNMHVGGSKGSISGNYAMANADLLIVIGSRAVCQADCSGIGYKSAQAVININGDFADAQPLQQHDSRSLGDISAVAERLTARIVAIKAQSPTRREWLAACAPRRAEWSAYKRARFAAAPIVDEVWQRPALTQPAAIKIVADFAKEIDAAKFFDAGDVQANGFQIVEDDRTGDTFTESGASYMGFAPSALLASALADTPRYGIAFCGDGSFMMNPQILIDGVEHGVRGMIVIFDNRRMAAITGLQMAQYGQRVPHQRSRRRRLCAARQRGRRRARHARRLVGRRAASAALRTAHAHDGLVGGACSGLCGPDELGRSAPGANGTSATGARTCSANGSSRTSDTICG